jgi:hypothetical protein
MRCERYEQDLTVGAAGGTITSDLEAHLEGCVACREWLAEKRALLESVDRVLMADLDVEPSPALRHRVMSRVAQAERERRRIVPRAAAAALAAGLIIVLLAGAWARRPSATPLESSAATIAPGVPAGGAEKPETPEAETPSIPSTPRPLVARTSHSVRRGVPPATARDALVREPEVLVLPGQEEALRRFVAGLRDGSTPAPPLLLSGASVESLIAPAPLIEIPLLETNPLADSVELQERSHS